MSQTADEDSRNNSDSDSIPEVWRPGWAVPAASTLKICSLIVIYLIFIFSCFLAFNIVTGLTSFLQAHTPEETVLNSLIGLGALFGFALYPKGAQRKVCGIVIAILFAIIFITAFVLDSVDFIGAGILTSLLYHGTVIGAINMGKYADSLASPERWRKKHLQNNQCPHCRYNISNLSEPRCPECGETW